MPKTPAPEAVEPTPPAPPATPATPSQGGSYVRDPETGKLVREGGTAPADRLTPNPSFDAPEA